jgi:8-oxo-dGTP diphosphatase
MIQVTKELIKTLSQTAADQCIVKTVVGGVIHQTAKNNVKKILVLKRLSSEEDFGGIDELPSGTVEKDEDGGLLGALKREVLEETGLQVSETSGYLGFFDYISGSGKNTRQFNFLVQCDLSVGIKLDPSEHEGYAWIMKSELNRYNITPQTQDIIKSAFETLEPQPQPELAAPASPEEKSEAIHVDLKISGKRKLDSSVDSPFFAKKHQSDQNAEASSAASLAPARL